MSKITVSPTSSVSSTLRSVARALPPITERDASCSAPRMRLSLALNAAMKSGKQRAQHDNADCKRRHYAVDVDGLDAAHVVASLRQPMKCGEGEQKPQRAAGGRKQQTLQQPLAHQTQPAPAQCGTDSQL